MPNASPPDFRRLRWFGLAWLALLVPCYWREYGPMNFLQLCDIALFLTVIGWWIRSPLLLSSQLVSCLLVDTFWCVDFFGRFLTGRSTIKLAEYMFSPNIPLFIRGISLFHIFWPVLLILSVRKAGYDRRALPLQALISLLVMTVSLMLTPVFAPGANINNVFRFPVTERAVAGQPTQMLLTWALTVTGLYVPGHLVLSLLWGKRKAGE